MKNLPIDEKMANDIAESLRFFQSEAFRKWHAGETLSSREQNFINWHETSLELISKSLSTYS